VFYTASIDSPKKEAYRAVYSVGIRNLIESLVEQGQTLTRLIFVSSTGVYAQQSGEWVDEDSPAEPTHASARYLLEGETRVKNSPFPSAVVRFGGIYGPGRIRLLERISIGKEAYPQDRTQYTNLIHLDDCVGILSHLMGLCNTAPLYVAVDMEPVDRRVLLHWLADRLHAPKPHMLPSSSLPSRQLRSNKRCNNRRLIDSGYHFLFPTFKEGYGSLIKNFSHEDETSVRSEAY
jgi:nucleoside-diphosphate-sugar epimerase